MLFLMCVAMLMASVEMKSVKTDAKGSEPCFDTLGCFSNGPPFESSHRPVSSAPQSPDEILTTFVLYTRESRDKPQILDARFLKTIPQEWVNLKARPTKILINGFKSSIAQSIVWNDIEKELLTFGDYNVILVDWSNGNGFPYPQATANSRVVGAQTSELVKAIIAAIGVTPADFHIIGHSLGAHAAGYVGERIPGLGRITGLDPSGTNFEGTARAVRLDEGDAVFVDVIHTNGDSLPNLGLGTKTKSGHADFYPNLGHQQTGCRVPLLKEIVDFVTGGDVLEELECSHQRALTFFKESINSPCPFMAFPCTSEEDFVNNLCQSCSNGGCGYMGFHADKNIPPAGQLVNYYLFTGDTTPFCRYHFTSTINLSAGNWSNQNGDIELLVNGDSSPVNLFFINGETFTPGTTYQFIMTQEQDFGNVQSVTLTWESSADDNDNTIKPNIYLDKISINRMEANVNTTFCAEGKGIASKDTLTITKTC